MKKITTLLGIGIITLLVLTGCQTLGDKVDQKYKGEEEQEQEQGQEEKHEGEEKQEDQKQTEEDGDENKEDKEKDTIAAEYNNIFFGSKKYDPEVLNCYGVYWVDMSGYQNAENAVERNIKLLLDGPSNKWAEAGYYTNIPEGTKLNSVEFKDDVIYLDFSKELNSGGGSCAVTQARQQIIMTAKYAAIEHMEKYQNKSTEDLEVIISVEGDTEEVLQP